MADQARVLDFPNRPPRKGRYWPHVIAALALALLAIMSVLLWLELTNRFPNIAPGAYLGTIEGRALGLPESESVGLFIDKSSITGLMAVAVLAEGWKAQSVNLPSGPDQAHSIVPLSIGGMNSSLIFTGRARSDGGYEGEVQDQLSGRKGRWEIKSLGEAGAKKDQELTLWTSLLAELAEVESTISRDERLVPEQRTEIESLTRVISDAETFRNKAGEKFEAYRRELRDLKAELDRKAQEAAKLEAALDVSRRVSGMGRLVQLSRDSLEREWRWIDSMLRTEGAASSDELEAAVDRARKIEEIKQEIAEERRKLQGQEDFG